MLATYFLLRGLRERRADYALGGVISGLMMYTYLSSRLAVVTIVLVYPLLVLTDPSGWRASLRRSWAGILILLVGASWRSRRLR